MVRSDSSTRLSRSVDHGSHGITRMNRSDHLPLIILPHMIL